jgi:hypothetical protein
MLLQWGIEVLDHEVPFVWKARIREFLFFLR